MASRLRQLALLSCGLIAVSGSPAKADTHRSEPVAGAVERIVGGGARLTDAGLYRVAMDRGPALLTHGPDAHPPLASGPAASGFEAGSTERPPVCATQDAQRILYAHPAGSADNLAAVRPEIQAAVRRMNAVLNEASLASGGPTADYRVRCDSGGAVSVEGFTTSGSSFAEIVSSARAAGFDSELVDYAIFFDGQPGGSCGIASYNADESLAADNLNNFGGGYAVVYSSCWFTEGAMHEIGHTMGAVQYGAPHSTGSGGHCYDERDVMCYSPDGGDQHQEGSVTNCDGPSQFDCGFDDYFDSAPEPGEYLAAHWNLGSPLNAFISFGGETAGVREQSAKWRLRKIRVRRHTRRLQVSVRAVDGVALYVSRGHRPSESRFACRDRARAGRATCRIRRPHRGRWVVGVLRPAGAPRAALRITRQLAKQR